MTMDIPHPACPGEHLAPGTPRFSDFISGRSHLDDETFDKVYCVRSRYCGHGESYCTQGDPVSLARSASKGGRGPCYTRRRASETHQSWLRANHWASRESKQGGNARVGRFRFVLAQQQDPFSRSINMSASAVAEFEDLGKVYHTGLLGRGAAWRWNMSVSASSRARSFACWGRIGRGRRRWSKCCCRYAGPPADERCVFSDPFAIGKRSPKSATCMRTRLFRTI